MSRVSSAAAFLPAPAALFGTVAIVPAVGCSGHAGIRSVHKRESQECAYEGRGRNALEPGTTVLVDAARSVDEVTW